MTQPPYPAPQRRHLWTCCKSKYLFNPFTPIDLVPDYLNLKPLATVPIIMDTADDIRFDQPVFDTYGFSTNDETRFEAIAGINLQYVKMGMERWEGSIWRLSKTLPAQMRGHGLQAE